jgi:predicted amidohydrolase YtcJ
MTGVVVDGRDPSTPALRASAQDDGGATLPRVPPTISLAIVNARVRTGDALRPWAEAIAIEGDRIAAVGSSAEVRKLARQATIIDAGGALVTSWRALPTASADDTVPHDVEQAPHTLSRGMPANLVLMDRAVPTEAPAPVGEAGVRLTIVAGRIVHDVR